MRALPLPIEYTLTTFEEIARSKYGKRRTLLLELSPKIGEAYESYSGPHLVTLKPLSWDADQKDALLNCYTSETEAGRAMRQKLLDAAGSFCPYCGIDRPMTLDHFLPKNTFPEFAIYAPNLVPCCDPCNRIKDESYCLGQQRLFLHAYFDRVPQNSACLIARIHWNGKTPAFEFALQECAATPAVVLSIVKQHVQRLDLLRWYGKRAGEEFTSTGDWRGSGITAKVVKENLERSISQLRASFGPLSWRAALWSAVLDDDTAISYLIA